MSTRIRSGPSKKTVPEGPSTLLSPGRGFASVIQSVSLDAGLNHAACAMRFKCMTGQRRSRHSVSSSRQRDMGVDDLTLGLLGARAVEAVAAAIVRAVLAAESLHGVPAAAEWRGTRDEG